MSLKWVHAGFLEPRPLRAFLSLLLLLAIPFVADEIRVQIHFEHKMFDLVDWLQLSRSFVAQPTASLYEDHPRYLYSPFFLVLIHPLTYLPARLAVFTFETMKWAALVLSLRLIWRMVARPGEDVTPLVALATIVFASRFIGNDLGQGNTNILVLLTMAAGVWAISRRYMILAGVLIALGASIKLTPALFFAYFVYRRWWGAVAGAVIGAALFLVLLPAAAIGWNENLAALDAWYHHVVLGFVQHGDVVSTHINQSLTAILNRLFGMALAIPPDTHVTLVALSPKALAIFRATLAVAILIILAWACRGRVRLPDDAPVVGVEAGLVLIGMLLFSGYSWKAHFVTMLIPAAAAFAWLSDARYAGPKRLVLILMILSFALGTLTCDLITPHGADYAEAYGAIALSAVLAGVALVVIRRSIRQGAGIPEP